MAAQPQPDNPQLTSSEINRLGVIGGGQLAWMMAGAAKKLGIELAIQTPNPSDPAYAIASKTILAPVDDAIATATLASHCDAITFENEFVDLEALSLLAQQGICFRPNLQVLAQILDKYDQRCYLQQIGLPVPEFITLEEFRSQKRAVLEQGSRGAGEHFSRGSRGDIEHFSIPRAPHPPISQFPLVLKARRHGYDGQGTFIIKDLDTLEQKLASSQPGQFLLEEFVPFERELAVIAARSTTGEIVTYPIVETVQQEQVCRRVLVPAEISPDIAKQVKAIAHTLLHSLQAVGIFGIELFLTPEGKLLVNEIAPRTHNSGHFSLDACDISQFEMHLRAVCGLPLANPNLLCQGAVMVNLLGYEHSENDYLPQRQQIAQIPQAHVHWYGKTTSRPGRKLGHVTVLLNTTSRSLATAIATQVESIWYPKSN